MNGELNPGAMAPPDAAATVWANLQGLVSDGVRVQRDVLVEGVIAPFAVVASKVAIDIKLPTSKDAALARAERDVRLVNAGWRVLTLESDVALSPKLLSAHVGAFLKTLSAADETRGKH